MNTPPPPDSDGSARPQTIAELRYAEARSRLHGRPLPEVFQEIHRSNLWGSAESVSGLGSELAATARIRADLPPLLQRLAVRTLLDLPCGDFSWLGSVQLPLERYLGADIVEDIVRRNAARFATSHPNATFLRLDLTRDPLPDADALLCRDCLVHLPYAAILDVFRNIRRSRIRWVILTTFTRRQTNTDIEAGDWRPLNLELPPFCLPPPLETLVEECPEENGAYADKALAVWSSNQLSPA